MSTAYNRTCFQLTAYDYMWFVSDCLTDDLYSVQMFIMDPPFYDTHVIHYHMDPLQLVAPGQSYLTLQLSGHSLLDPGHPTASNNYHSNKGTKCLEVFPHN